MYEIEVIAIAVVFILVLVAWIVAFIIGPNGPFARAWRDEARELEVKVRMNQGPELIENLRDLAKLYARLGRKWDGEQTFRRAVLISEQQFGESNPTLIPVLEDYAGLMDSMNRRKEAAKMRKRAREIAEKKSG